MNKFVSLILIISFSSCVTTSFKGNTLNETVFDGIEIGKTVLVNDPEISKFAFMYYIPEESVKHDVVKTVFVGNGLPSPEYSEVVEGVKWELYWMIPYAEEHGYVLLSVIVPDRAQYLARNAMIPNEIKKSWWERPDLEYRKVIEAFTTEIEESGFNIHNKVFMTGFSNGGIQSNLFSLLHPDMVEATAIGAAGVFAYPAKEVNGVKMNWPLGLATDISYTTFTPELFKEVEHLIFVGSEDVNNDPLEFKYDEYKSELGETTADRVPIFAEYLDEYGVKEVICDIYEGVGHEWKEEMRKSIFEFFDSISIQ